MWRKNVPSLCAAVAAAALVSCSGAERAVAASARAASTEPAPAQPAVQGKTAAEVDPCTLLEGPALAALFGELKEGPTAGSGLRNERQCSYTNMSGAWIKFSLYAGLDRWEWEKEITSAQGPRELAGAGDEAFAVKRGSDSVVYVRKGASILELSCSCSSQDAERIARKVAAKL